MKNKIYPCIWFNNYGDEAAQFYCTVFENSRISHGNSFVTNLVISDQQFMLINGGEKFKPNPCLSFYTTCETELEIDTTWNKLIDGGKAMMPLNKYPWSEKYGWLEDKYGVSWQLTLGKISEIGQKITPLMMFTKEQNGRGQDAINHYTSIFTNASEVFVSKFDKKDILNAGNINHGRFKLCNQTFILMDGGVNHEFGFTEGNSLVISCENQTEIDHYWDKLSEGGSEGQCGWLKDKFGFSWQVIPSNLGELMSDPERSQKVMEAFIKMKKFDIETLINV